MGDGSPGRRAKDVFRPRVARRRRFIPVCAGLAVVGAVAVGWLVLAPGGRAGNPADGVRFGGIPAVGALFAGRPGARHFCTAGVVSSPGRDLVVTAAHCVTGSGTGLVFVPGYRDGKAPYGLWNVVAAYGAAGWLSRQDPHEDVVFLVVADHRLAGRTVGIEDLTGGAELGTTPAPGLTVTVVAYPQGVDDLPIRCRADVYSDDGYPAFNCGGYVDGTSGAPWLVRRASGVEQIVAVSGGRNQGGCEPGTSYAAPFTPTILQLYRRAISGAPASLLPAPRPSGC